MDHLAVDVLPLGRLAVVATFLLLTGIAVIRAPRSGRAGWWVAAAFGSMGVALIGIWLPETVGLELPPWLRDGLVVIVFALPYLLLRFTASFRDLPRWIEVAAAAGLAAVVTATFAILVSNGDAGSSASRRLTAYFTLVLTYWLSVSSLIVVRLWRAGRGQPTVARRRMRLMAVATAVLVVALLVVASQPSDGNIVLRLAVDMSALASAVAFGFGFSPPRMVRLSWRRPEERQLQEATTAVLRADTEQEVARRLLPPMVRLVGGRGATLINAEGWVVASYGDAPAAGSPLQGAKGSGASQVVPLGSDGGELVVWTSPYAPFFAQEEADLLRTMGAVVSLALERCQLLHEERSKRAALQRANEVAEQAREEASRANTAKSEFLSRMSHELRTPLNAILGFGQLLETSQLPAEDQEAVGHIQKAGHHLLALINDVLDLSRVEAGTLTVSVEGVHPGEVIDDAVALMRPLAESRSIRLVTEPVGSDTWIATDRQRCRQILLNLLSNAVKYNHDGGEVAIRCGRLTDDRVRISIRDTGPGISPGRLGRLFEPFDRLGAETSNVEGTGLGLALTKQLVERLGGSIGVETEPGRGATFWIDMPPSEAPPRTLEPLLAPDRPTDIGERTLLLVEDNLANLRLVEAMLRRRPGVRVLPAMQGRLAIELANEHRPDVIVLDLHLPDVPGHEVLHRLKADLRTRDIPVIIASADASPGRVQGLRDDGAFDYITKPLDVTTFLDAIEAALAIRDHAARTLG
ncbi:MAG TPA: ATP-binding protein [Nitriliruptorales bacterium]|nr:ATP-binding protein [Nitriliruptorales bacterium]